MALQSARSEPLLSHHYSTSDYIAFKEGSTWVTHREVQTAALTAWTCMHALRAVAVHVQEECAVVHYKKDHFTWDCYIPCMQCTTIIYSG